LTAEEFAIQFINDHYNLFEEEEKYNSLSLDEEEDNDDAEEEEDNVDVDETPSTKGSNIPSTKKTIRRRPIPSFSLDEEEDAETMPSTKDSKIPSTKKTNKTAAALGEAVAAGTKSSVSSASDSDSDSADNDGEDGAIYRSDSNLTVTWPDDIYLRANATNNDAANVERNIYPWPTEESGRLSASFFEDNDLIFHMLKPIRTLETKLKNEKKKLLTTLPPFQNY